VDNLGLRQSAEREPAWDFIVNVTGTLAIDERARDWCRLPYPDHPKGCPNWNRKSACPPAAPLVSEVFDLSEEHWFAVVVFDLSKHRDEMLAKHPDWSTRQSACCLYWQNSVSRRLRKLCDRFCREKPGTVYTLLPEAMGVNVFKTARHNGIAMRRSPEDIVYKIALLGLPAKRP